MNQKSLYIILLPLMALLIGCIEDGYTTSPSDQPYFSVDTLDLGLVYTAEITTTSRMTVHNPHDKGLNISQVSLSGEGAGYFRVNVDGMSGTTFRDIEIRANDSIYVFVEANIPENGTLLPVDIKANLDFLVNGVTSSVVLAAQGQDIIRLNGALINEDTTFEAGKPIQVKDSLVVAEGAQLTIEAGAKLLMHDKSYIRIYGSLVVDGTPEAPVTITGDRTGELLPDVSFDIMSRQWDGLEFMASSHDNSLAYTEVSNTSYGVALYGDGTETASPKLVMERCRLRNSGDNVFTAIGASVEAYGCEFAEGAYNLAYLVGGKHRFEQCTFANYYLYVAPSSPAMYFETAEDVEAEYGRVEAEVVNCIIYGLSPDMYPGELDGYEIYVRHCLLKSDGTDDNNFLDCLWNQDPLYYTVRNDYYFDYRLQEESPAIGVAWPSLNTREYGQNFYGEAYAGNLGAY